MAKTYFRCDIADMRLASTGGRLHSVVTNKEIPNGFIGYLGDMKADNADVRTLLDPTAELIGKGTPVIVMKPEINYREEKASDALFGIFRNPANKPVPAIPFVEFDGIDLSEDYFTKTGDVAVGDIFKLAASGVVGSQLVYSATAPTDAKGYFKVVGIKNSNISSYYSGEGVFLPKPYKMIQLTYVLA